MFKDLIVNIVEGGFMPEMDKDGNFVFKGIQPPYLSFSSEALKLNSRKKPISNGKCSGYISRNKQKLFYFEYREKGHHCRVYPVIDGVRSDHYMEPPSTLTLVD